jgi:hypothetical protein
LYNCCSGLETGKGEELRFEPKFGVTSWGNDRHGKQGPQPLGFTVAQSIIII